MFKGQQGVRIGIMSTSFIDHHNHLIKVLSYTPNAGHCCHTFRVTEITAYLENGGTLENAQARVPHERYARRNFYDRPGNSMRSDDRDLT